MSTWIRLMVAVAASAIILTSSGCLSTEKFRGPQWLSFHKDPPVEPTTGLPDPSTLAVPTTVTQPAASGQQASEVASQTSPPLNAPLSGSQSIAAADYPSTNQPAPHAASAGFLPSENVAAIPAASSGQSVANVQNGFYGDANPVTSAQPSAAAAVANATAPPQTGPPDPALAANPAPPASGATTWDQPASVPYPSTEPNTSIYASTPTQEPNSVYQTVPATTPDPAMTSSVYSTVGGNDVAGNAAEPSMYPTNPANPATANTVAPASYQSTDSHYEQMARSNESTSGGWRPGSTTNYGPGASY